MDVKAEMKKVFKELEKIELMKGTYDEKKKTETDYPKPLKRQYLLFESFGMSVEESYFWIKDMLHEANLPETIKIADIFTASEQSAFFGSAQQRLGIQQDKAASYLALIGRMVKELFQIVRDIRLLEERENLYTLAAKGDDGAEKALKGVWIDFVDNGPQGLKASSVYGMASQLGYTVLPDLFFAAKANLKKEDITAYVKTLDFNEKVKTALVRKLEQYVSWRDETGKEIAAKKKFTLQYLRQHYNAIKLYIGWVKPYLRNISRLGMDPETQLSTDIVGAFEGSVLKAEFIATRPGTKPGEAAPCVLATFKFRTRPVMQTGQDYQRGPVHLGRLEITLRGYAWTPEQIKEYQRIRSDEDLELLRSVDSSINEAMDLLGDKLKEYLSAAGEKFGKEDDIERLAKVLVDSKASLNIVEARKKAKDIIEGKKKKEEPDMIDSFKATFKGVGSGLSEFGKAFVPGFGKNPSSEEKKKHEKLKEAEDAAKGAVKFATSLTYTLYKKSHRLVTP